MSNNYWFFLSHSRQDNDAYLKKFFQDLSLVVRMLTEPDGKEAEAGFFPSAALQAGDYWQGALLDALQHSRALVCVYSPAYFASESCGREFGLFRERARAYAAQSGGPEPPVTLPVLWAPSDAVRQNLPESAAAVQFLHGGYGKTYAREGLRQLMALRKYRNEYREFLETLGSRLVELGRQYELPPAPGVESLEEVRSEFHSTEAQARPASPAGGAERVGPRYADFVFAAGTRSVIHELNRNLVFYGDHEIEWKPYWPSDPTEVGLMAQQIATDERLLCSFIPVGDDLVQRIGEAQDKKRIVLMAVDVWTLQLPRYERLLAQCDEALSWNSAVLVPWNEGDEQTATNHDRLRSQLGRVFERSAFRNGPAQFTDQIHSYMEFRHELHLALNRIRMNIINRGASVRPVVPKGGIPKPTIGG